MADYRTVVSFIEGDTTYVLDGTFNCVNSWGTRDDPPEHYAELVDVHSFRAFKAEFNEKVEVDEPNDDQVSRFEDLALESYECDSFDECDADDYELDELDRMTRDDFFMFEDSSPELEPIF